MTVPQFMQWLHAGKLAPEKRAYAKRYIAHTRALLIGRDKPEDEPSTPRDLPEHDAKEIRLFVNAIALAGRIDDLKIR